jgi:hypothetical protein
LEQYYLNYNQLSNFNIAFDSSSLFYRRFLYLEPIDAKESLLNAYREFWRTKSSTSSKTPTSFSETTQTSTKLNVIKLSFSRHNKYNMTSFTTTLNTTTATVSTTTTTKTMTNSNLNLKRNFIDSTSEEGLSWSKPLMIFYRFFSELIHENIYF